MDVPAAWLVRPREALHDLDNIQLSSLPQNERAQGVTAVYQLDFIVIEGHARDAITNVPPRGLQLELETLDSTPVDDTLVVANLGYFQFKAKPGVFRLAIREGGGRDVYAMDSVGNLGWHSPNVSQVGDEVTLTSFEGLTLYPRVRRKPNMANANVLTESPKTVTNEGLLGKVISGSVHSTTRASKRLMPAYGFRVTSFFHPETKQAAMKTASLPQADINIFTVASGLLYEV